MNGKVSILIVDDDVPLLESCSKILAKNGRYEVFTSSDGREASERLKTKEYDVIISDLAMPEVDGFDLLEKAKVLAPATPFVIFSAYGNVERVVEAMRRGAFDFIEKPFKAERLKVVIEKSLQYRTLHKEKRALKKQLRQQCSFDNIIGKSSAMQQVFDLISRVAPGESNVTITGGSGTGKELVARSIHSNSARASKAFVPVNCGAFPEHLFESELFGHEKGAFTGAFRRKHGLLEYADGGTFFLDEICELSLALQVKLLRLLQERKIRRVGGNGLIDVDVRIISASNQNLEKAVADGCLREDLYYRLNVISIHLPRLQDRIEDIPILCSHFVEKYSKQTPKNIKGVSDEAIDRMQKYDWPGNVRELENVIERAITLAAGEWVDVADLSERILRDSNNNHHVQIDMPLKEAKSELVSEFEKKYLTMMLARHNGNISQAASKSGIDRRTFHRLLNRHQIRSKSWKAT